MRTYKPTASQQLIWLDQRIAADSCRYNIGGYTCLEGHLVYPHFHETIRSIVHTQEAYQTIFLEKNGILECHINNSFPEVIAEVLDFSGEADPEAAAAAWMARDFAKPFTMEGSHLFHWRLLKITTEKHYWYAKMHHLISDGWSFRLLLNQAADIYSSCCAGNTPVVPEYRYSDYATDDNRYYQSGEAGADKAFWLEQFRQLPADLFQKTGTPTDTTAIAGTETLRLSAAQKEMLQNVAAENNASLFQLIISLMLIYFSRTSCGQGIAFGVPVLNRTKKQYRNTAGMFMNLLCLPFEVHDTHTLSDVIREVKRKMSAFLRHQRYQYGNLVSDLNLKQQHKQLYHVRFSYEDFDFTTGFGELQTNTTAFSNLAEVDPLAIYVRDYNGQGFDVRMIYNTAFLSHEMIQQISNSLRHLTDTLPHLLNSRIQEIDLFTPTDKDNILSLCVGEKKEYVFQSFPDMWEAAVAAYPARIAVTCGNRQFSYAALHTMALQMAALIKQHPHYAQGSRIALMLPRTEKMIAAMLAAMMCDLTYIPLDDTYPPARILFMLQDAGCTMVLTVNGLPDSVNVPPGTAVITAEELPAVPLAEERTARQHPLCYIIYTSGSTGKPKGVEISHSAMVDYINTFREYYGLTPADVVLQQASFSFDTSVEEIFPVLSAGGRLHILEDRRDLSSLKQSLYDQHITLLSTTPLVVRWLNGSGLPSSLRILISGGDVLRPEDVKDILNGPVAVYNTYGPTESTVCASYHKVTATDAVIPIGKAIANREIYILDRSMHLQPFGVEGEIFLGGRGLAAGYTGNQPLTAERFPEHPFRAGEKLYRTGDAGRMLPDGSIIFRGRVDEQLSFRGYRIEAGEVETAILAQPGVKEVVATVGELEQVPVLTAYVVYTDGNEYTLRDWRRMLQDRLPAHMIPGAWITLPALPLLPNGKTDKQALPPLSQAVLKGNNTERVLPSSELEKQISDIWKEFLPVTDFGVDDSFFELGGHSLNIMQLESQYQYAFGVSISVGELFRYTTIADHASLIESKTVTAYHVIPVAPQAASYPLSAGQRRIWLLSQMEEASRSYHLGGNLVLQGEYHPGYFEQAIRAVIERHEILRTVFREDENGMPCQVILNNDDCLFKLNYKDLGAAGKEEAWQYIREMRSKAFDLASWPLINAGLVRLGPNRYCCWFNMHHIISDGWSMELLNKEIFRFYHAFKDNVQLTLTPLRIQYKEYVLWKQRQLQTGGLSESRQYWLQQLGGNLPALELRHGGIRPLLKSYNGGLLATRVPAARIAALRTLCQTEGCTLYMGLMGVLLTLLHRYSGHTDIILGTPIAGRDHADLEDQIGFYVNTLAMRTRFKATDSFTELLQQVRTVALGGYEHQVYPFDLLMEELALKRDISRSALFDVMLVLQSQYNRQTPVRHHHVLQENVVSDLGITAAKFDFTFDFNEQEDGLEMWVEYNTDIYSKAMVKDLIVHFCNILAAVTETPALPVNRIVYLSPGERHTQLHELSKTVSVPLTDETLVTLFTDQVRRQPDAVSLQFRDQSYTFAEVDAWSSRLAHHLLERLHAAPGNYICVCLPRSEWMIISLLAVLKAGCAYIPVDPSHPEDRISYILSDSGAKILVDENAIREFLAIKDQYTATAPDIKVLPEDLCYVIYTSGSTGRPKGCMLEHRNVVNRLLWGAGHFNICATDAILQKTTFAFDVSVFEIFTPLCCGCRMVLCEDADVYSPERIADIISRRQVTIMHFVPAMLQNFLLTEMQTAAQLSRLSSLRRIYTSGEELPLNTLQEWHSKTAIPLSNLYGPTETTVEVTYYDTVPGEQVVPIGKAVQNSTLYVVDEYGELLPRGAVGELYVGGVQVARGYLGREELTAARFIPDTFEGAPGARLYKTGDQVRWLPDGNLAYMGRADDQVKIRGYRIELGEVEHALQQQPGVAAASVVVHTTTSGDKLLVAYVICQKDTDMRQLRTGLSALLPEYMLPAWIFPVDSFPLTANGKVDRKAFPAPESLNAEPREFIAPRNEMEERISGIWQELLHYKQAVSVNTDFFDLGGHSLKLMQLINKYQRLFNVKLQVPQLFRHTTIAAHAWLLEGGSDDTYHDITPAPQQADYPVSDGQRRMWILSQLEDASRSYHLTGTVPLPAGYDAAAMEKAIHTVITRHEVLRTVFRENSIGELRQVILPEDRSPFIFDITGAEDAANANAYIRKRWDELLDLATGPLLKAGLVHLSDGSCVCWFNMHHIISDGWSMEIFKQEIFACYEAICREETITLPPLRIQYKDYAVWQARHNGREISAAHDYWTALFNDSIPVLELPVKYRRPPVKTYHGRLLSSYIGPAVVGAFTALCQQQGSTLFMGLLGVLNTLLYRYSGQSDIVVGTAVAGRSHADLEDQIGFYVNTLALRNRFEGTDSFAALLERIKEQTLQAFSHQAYPFDRLVEELPIRRDSSRHALFDVMLVLQHRQESLESLRTITVPEGEIADGGVCTAKFDYTFYFTERAEGLDFNIEFNTDIYDQEMAASTMRHFVALLQAVTADPLEDIAAIRYLSEREEKLLRSFNHTQAPYAAGQSICDVFAGAAARCPGHSALVDGEEIVTYRMLDERSNQLAHYLLSQGVSREDRVALCMGRSAGMIISILAVLKAGAAYVPVDPAYPTERIRFMLEDTGAAVILCKGAVPAFPELADHYTVFDLDNEQAQLDKYPDTTPDRPVSAGSLAYVIYTSGSTGRPKGVLVEHAGIVNLSQTDGSRYQVQPESRITVMASPSFDGIVWEIYTGLLNGATLYIVPEELRFEEEQLAEFFVGNSITHCFVTTGMVPVFLNQEKFRESSLQYLVTGGDQLKINREDKYTYQLINGYGPTENTVFSTAYAVNHDYGGELPPIGRPVANAACYIADGRQQLCPVGVPGELYVKGPGLARGYLNLPELTAEKFIPDHFMNDGTRMYRTGDLARWLPDGNIEFLGRIDQQVKIRGYRVEPGETAHALLLLPDILDAIVVPAKLQNGPQHLVAYIVGSKTLSVTELRRMLGERIPEYMIPSHFVQLEQMPLTSNGKVDRARLPEPSGLLVDTGATYIPPRTDTEKVLAAIYHRILGQEKIGVRDNFFDLGGNSMLLMKIRTAVRQEFEVPLQARDLLRLLTIEELAAAIDGLKWLHQGASEEQTSEEREEVTI